MSEKAVHVCGCATCAGSEAHPDKQVHHQINLLLSRLDEQQRRWYVAIEATRHGRGGIGLLSQITGLDEKTIARGQRELAGELQDRPSGRVRLPGGGRPAVEKKVRRRKAP